MHHTIDVPMSAEATEFLIGYLYTGHLSAKVKGSLAVEMKPMTKQWNLAPLIATLNKRQMEGDRQGSPKTLSVVSTNLVCVPRNMVLAESVHDTEQRRESLCK